MRFEPAKSILQPVAYGGEEAEFFPRSYNMNLYRGCSHGCVYCDARSACYRLDAPGEVRAKADALTLLREELRRRRQPGIVGLGGMSDGYNPEEARHQLTRGALALLAQYGFGIGITTKSPLVARDIDRLTAIRRHAPAHVTFSITTADDALARRTEPGVAVSSARLNAMRRLADAGILTGMWINPVLPFLTDGEDNFRALLAAAKESGASYVHTYYGMTLREGNREHYYAALDRHFPGMKKRYAERYGLAYVLPSPNAQALDALFTRLCGRMGLAHTFEETRRLVSASGGHAQATMF